MPTIATRSLIPLLAICFPPDCGAGSVRSALGPRFPKVIMNTVGSKEPAESHLNFVAKRDFIRLTIGHLAHKAPAAVVINDHVDRWRVERVGQAVDGIRGDSRGTIGERIWFH